MKREAFVVGFLLIISLGFVSAQTTCSDDQRIFSMSDQTNAHGELWDSGNYVWEVCYDTLFGGAYTGANPHACTLSNAVLRLSGNTNAHAEGPGQNNLGYNDVCFGDLNCEEKTSCLSGETEIVRLSSSTNAHLALGASGNYGVRICCVTGGTIIGSGTEINSVEWRDFSDRKIGVDVTGVSYDVRSYVGNSVKLVAESDFSAGTVINFEIFEDDPLGDDDIRTGSNALTATTDSSGTAVAIWTISDTDIANGDDSGAELNPWEFYFIASKDSSSLQSSVLEVENQADPDDENPDSEVGDGNDTSDDSKGSPGDPDFPGGSCKDAASCNCQNGQPVCDGDSDDDGEIDNGGGGGDGDLDNDGTDDVIVPVVVGLYHKGIYYVNTPILFNGSASSDAESEIDFKWTINNKDGLEFSSEEKVFTYTFNSGGQRTITLRVTDSSGKSDEEQIAILVVDPTREGLLTFINDPFHKEIVTSSSLNVNYNAKHSYVVLLGGSECAGSDPYTISCVAGICPFASENTPNHASCEPGRIPVVNGATNLDWDDIDFQWITESGISFGGAGDVAGVIAYGIESNSKNDKSLSLGVSYDDGSTVWEENHTRQFTLGQCVNNGGTFLSVNNGKISGESSTLSVNGACVGGDGLSGTNDDCCPGGFTCREVEGITKCVGGGSEDPQVCEDYSDENACRNDAFNVKKLDPLWDNECTDGIDSSGRVVKCECKWDSGGSGECGLAKEVISDPSVSDPIGIGRLPCSDYLCTYTYTQGECVNGFKEITVLSSYTEGTCGTGSGECAEEGTRKIPCGRLNIELEFFGLENFIFSFALLILIYLIVFLKTKRV